MSRNEILKDELVVKIDSSSLANIDRFIDLLISTNTEVEVIGQDESLRKRSLWRFIYNKNKG